MAEKVKIEIDKSQFDGAVKQMINAMDAFKKSVVGADDATKKFAKDQTENVNKAGQSWKQMAAGVFAGGAALEVVKEAGQKAVEFLTESYKAYEQVSKQERLLLIAMGNRKDLTEILINQAERMSESLGIPHEVILQAQRLGAEHELSAKKIGEATLAASNLAAATGEDLNSAMVKVLATYEGSIGRLGRMSKDFKTLTADQLANGDAVDMINEKYANLGEQSATGTEKLSTAWERLMESVGKAMQVITPALTWLTNEINYLSQANLWDDEADVQKFERTQKLSKEFAKMNDAEVKAELKRATGAYMQKNIDETTKSIYAERISLLVKENEAREKLNKQDEEKTKQNDKDKKDILDTIDLTKKKSKGYENELLLLQELKDTTYKGDTVAQALVDKEIKRIKEKKTANDDYTKSKKTADDKEISRIKNLSTIQKTADDIYLSTLKDVDKMSLAEKESYYAVLDNMAQQTYDEQVALIEKQATVGQTGKEKTGTITTIQKYKTQIEGGNFLPPENITEEQSKIFSDLLNQYKSYSESIKKNSKDRTDAEIKDEKDKAEEIKKTTADLIATLELQVSELVKSTNSKQWNIFNIDEMKQDHDKALELMKDLHKKEIDAAIESKMSAEELTKLKQKLSNEEVDFKTANIQKELDEEKKRNEYIMQNAINAAEGIMTIVTNQLKAESDARINTLEEQQSKELSMLKKQLDNKIITDAQYNDKKLKIDEKYAAQIRKEKEKQWKIDRDKALIDIAIKTAVAAMTAAAEIGPWGAPIAIALGLIEAGIVLSQPMPKFAKGGFINGPSHTTGGVPLVAEGGEFIVKKDVVKQPGMMNMLNNINNGSTTTTVSVIDDESINRIISRIAAIPVTVVETDISTTQRKVNTIEAKASI